MWNRDKFRCGDLIKDQSDGLAYKEFMERVTPNIEPGTKIISLTLNADGVKIFADTKNKKSVWPFYLVVNEISKEQRYAYLDFDLNFMHTEGSIFGTVNSLIYAIVLQVLSEEHGMFCDVGGTKCWQAEATNFTHC